MRSWVQVSDKVTKKDMEKVDVSRDKSGGLNLQHEKDKYLGGDEDVLEGFYNSGDELDFENFKRGGKKTSATGKGLFSKLTSAFQSMAGNKVLEESDMEGILKQFKDTLMEKNVAAEIAEGICQSVTATLVDKRTESFTSVKTTVKNALIEAITKLLTPKRNIDLLKDALTAKQRGQVYSAVFIGVNGVGKSTSLAKVAYYLKTKGGLRVMIAGCDNFRSGAIEQL
jgi:signal recognition particle receptor subunit alpha